VLVVRIVRPDWLFAPRGDRPELAELVAAVAKEPTRPVEGRLTGGFKYAPPPSTTRGAIDRRVSPDLRIAAAKLETLSTDEETPAHFAAAGVAYLAIGELDKAIAALQRAASDGERAEVLSDLSAAYLARANAAGDRSPDWQQALDAARRARAVQPDLMAARFNEALALEGLGSREEAREAWQAVRDSSEAGWREEAEAHLRALAETSPRR
jgi:tetratricopeptide (TPR) repeat protein